MTTMTWKLVYSLLLLRGYVVVVNTQVCSDMEEMKCNKAEKSSQCEFTSGHFYYNVTIAVTEEVTNNERNQRHTIEENCYFIMCSRAPVFPENRPTENCSIVEHSCSKPPDFGTCQECPQDIARGVAIGIAAFLGFILLCAVAVIVLLVLLVKELHKQSAIKSGLPNPCGSVLTSLQKILTHCCYCVKDHCSCIVSNTASHGRSNADSQPSSHYYINTRGVRTPSTVYRKPQNIPKPHKDISNPLRNVKSSPIGYEMPQVYEDMA